MTYCHKKVNFELNSFGKSLDIKDFDISFARGLSLEDGCATITNFTAYLIAKGIEHANGSNIKPIKYLVCGGGRVGVTGEPGGRIWGLDGWEG